MTGPLQAVVVYKRTALAAMGGVGSAAWRSLPKDTCSALREADSSHRKTMRQVQDALAGAGIRARTRYRGDVKKRLDADLVVTVGGDGTLLYAAGFVDDAPVLAVNSDTRYSVGVFTGATGRTVGDAIAAWQRGRLREIPLPRMRVSVEHGEIRWPVLNEALLASRNPAEMTRYRIAVGRRTEDHRCSGLYVATGPGSTGAIRSAGGKILPLRSRRLQFLAREPYVGLGPRTKLARGLVGASGLAVIPLARGCTLFCDGSHRQVALRPGDEARFTPDGPPLRILGLDPERRRRPWRSARRRRGKSTTTKRNQKR